MRINAISFAITGAAIVCILYTSIALILKYLPGQTLKLIGTIYMIPKLDYLKPFIKVTPQAIATGIITHMAIAFIIFGLIASIYNLLQRIIK